MRVRVALRYLEGVGVQFSRHKDFKFNFVVNLWVSLYQK